MVQNKFWVIFLFSLLAGVVTALAFTASFWGKFDFYLIFQDTAITVAALIVGVFLGALLSPLAYGCLRDKKLSVTLPLLYIAAFAATAGLNLLGFFLGFYGSLVFWYAALPLAKIFAPERRK